jgi:hypothetical protein
LKTLADGMNYTLLEKALDLNNNGKISKNDFMFLLEKAAVSSAYILNL